MEAMDGDPLIQANDRRVIRFVDPEAVTESVVQFGEASLEDICFANAGVEVPTGRYTSADDQC